MSRIIAYMITHEQGIRVTMALCMLAGFIVGASFLNVRRGMRRVIFYVWLTVVVVLSLVTFMTLWVLLAAAAQDGYASVLCAAALASWGLIGVLLYRVAAARSFDIRGDARRAWMALIPILSLWLVFKPGRAQPGASLLQKRSFGTRVGDVLIVLVAMFIVVGTRGLAENVVQTSPFHLPGGDELEKLVMRARLLERDLASYADGINAQLPSASGSASGTAISLLSAEAKGSTLQLDFVARNGAAPDDRATVAAFYCDSANLGSELGSGAQLAVVYTAPDGSPLERHEITSADCKATED